MTLKSWKLPAAGIATAAGLYFFVNHRLGAGVLLATLFAVFIAAVFGDTSSTR